MQQTSTVKVTIYLLKFKKRVRRLYVNETKFDTEIVPVDTILDLGLTTNQNVIKGPFFKFLRSILIYTLILGQQIM